MIEGVRAIGEAVLQKNPSIVEALINEEEVPEGQKRYVVHFNVKLEPPALGATIKELDQTVLTEVLWVDNARANNPQDRLTTDHLEYLISQTIPNLIAGLPEGDLKRKLKGLSQAFYLDLGEKAELFAEGGDAQYPRYRRIWDLLKLGLANFEFIEDEEKRRELEALCQNWNVGFLTKPFLQEYARQKGSAKAVVELVGSIVEAWVLKQLGIKRREAALYTLQVNGELLARHPDYRAYIERTLVEEAFEDARTRPGICHVCGRQAKVTKDTTRFKLLKFYITDKPGFASELRDVGFFRNYALCQHCYCALLAGERFVENQLRTRLARSSVYVIPVFHLPSIRPTASTLERWAEYLQTRIAATQTLEQWKEFQEKLKDYQELDNVKASFVLNLLFATKTQGAVKVDKLIQDVPPSRLDQLDAIRNRVRDKAEGFFGGSSEWDLSIGRIFYLFPIHKQGNQAQTRSFLEFLETLLMGRSLKVELLIPKLLETACVHYFERYGAYVQTSPGQDRQVVDQALTVFLLQSQLLLCYLKELGQLEGLQGGEFMDVEIEALEEPLRSYMEELGLNRGRRGLFLLGYLMGRIGSTPEQRSSGKPILNKVHFQGMDQGKIMRLSNEVYEKLRQYKIAEYNEAIYAAMKALLDREHESLNSPQENTYWILSGYAYATWQAIRAGKSKQEASLEKQD